MSEEKAGRSPAGRSPAVVAEPKLPVDEAMVVHEDPVASEEKVHEELVAAVTKKLDRETGETKQPGPDPEKPAKAEKPPQGEGEKGKAEPRNGLSQELQARVKGAGLTDDLAERLRESGQLEETLAAFDRSMIQYVQSKKTSEEEPPKDEGRREQKPPSKDEKVPTLDPDVYDEELVKRDAYQQRRIDALESQLAELMEGQQGGFDEWFDGTLTDLGFDTSDDEKCQSVFKAYGAICDAFGKNVSARDKAMVARAYAAMYPQDVFKQQQRQTVDRLRDAQGKFLTSSISKGGPPPKGATDDEVHEQLVSNVGAYLKEQGVQMSGV